MLWSRSGSQSQNTSIESRPRPASPNVYKSYSTGVFGTKLPFCSLYIQSFLHSSQTVRNSRQPYAQTNRLPSPGKALSARHTLAVSPGAWPMASMCTQLMEEEPPAYEPQTTPGIHMGNQSVRLFLTLRALLHSSVSRAKPTRFLGTTVPAARLRYVRPPWTAARPALRKPEPDSPLRVRRRVHGVTADQTAELRLALSVSPLLVSAL